MKNKIVLGGLTLLAFCLLLPVTAPSAQSSDKPAEITLSSDNVIVLNDEVSGQSVATVVEAAKALDSGLASRFSKKPIYLYLNTPGGSIQAGLELIEQLKGLNRPVHTITAFAASMGFQIAQNMGTRYILKSGVLMSHRARGGVEGEFGGQSPSQLDSRYNLWLSRLNEMDQQTVDRTKGKQTLASYQKAYASEMWRTGNQSVTEGYADEVATVKCDNSLSGVTSHEAVLMGFIPVTYDLSNCPMNTAPMNIKVKVPTNKGIKNLAEFQKLDGGFGYACLEAAAKNANKVCVADVNITPDKLYTAENTFRADYLNKQRNIVYMTVGK